MPPLSKHVSFGISRSEHDDLNAYIAICASAKMWHGPLVEAAPSTTLPPMHEVVVAGGFKFCSACFLGVTYCLFHPFCCAVYHLTAFVGTAGRDCSVVAHALPSSWYIGNSHTWALVSSVPPSATFFGIYKIIREIYSNNYIS